jgi:hypothetical protein
MPFCAILSRRYARIFHIVTRWVYTAAIPEANNTLCIEKYANGVLNEEDGTSRHELALIICFALAILFTISTFFLLSMLVCQSCFNNHRRKEGIDLGRSDQAEHHLQPSSGEVSVPSHYGKILCDDSKSCDEGNMAALDIQQSSPMVVSCGSEVTGLHRRQSV